MRKGLFITFEGSDGSGKSTQLSLLKEYLMNKGIRIITLREPGGVAISEKIRGIILDNRNTEMDPVAEMLLYAASRAQLVSQLIKPSLEKGITVICDRYVDSSYVYQGLARGLGIDTVKIVNDIATGNIMPDITFFMDIDPELALKRRLNSSVPDRLENESIEFHRNVYNGYLKLIEMYPERIKRINGEIGIEAAFSLIKEYIDALLCRYIE
ncbi:MAG: dTMP kinase [Clostridiaceae bacterium]|nr:dTMP kinase [Clostridiaceae bacterium]